MDSVDPNTVDSWIQGIDDDIERILSSPKAGTQWFIVTMKWLTKWRSTFGLKTDDMDLVESSDFDQEDRKMEVDENKIESNDPETAIEKETIEGQDEKTPIAPQVPIEDIGPVNNEDILEFNPAFVPNCILKKGLCLGKDYEILPSKAWNYFKETYGVVHEISRFSIQISKKETKVEISLKPIRVVYLKEKELSQEIIFQVSIKQSLAELEDLIKSHAGTRFQVAEDNLKVWLWKTNPEITENNLIQKLKTLQNHFPGVMLKGNNDIANLEIADNDLVIAEIVQLNESSFYKPFKKNSLENTLSSNSRKGLTGLQNLGNTCFMNSGLQCLSNTFALTEYILNNSYKSQINQNNRIGSKGKIISAYADLVREMWTGSSSSVSPWNLKKALGGFAAQFIGYSQQDSQEMLSFLIDGIHEDLNQAAKPKSSEIDETGLNEREVAEKYWAKHLERNQSIIVDLMHGQYRSEVTCLQCQNVSVAFDPFLMLTLPVPQKETMMKEVSVVIENSVTPYKLEIPFMCKVRDMLKKLPEELQSEFCLVGEAEGYSKEVKRIITKGETVEKHRDVMVFNHGPVPEDSVLIMCNFSSKAYNEHYGCGTPLGLTKVLILPKSTTQDFHIAFYKLLLQLIEQKELSGEELTESFRNAFPSLFSDKKEDFYSLNVYNPGRNPCVVCMKETCYGCKIPFKDESIEILLNRSKDPCLFLNLIFFGEKAKIASKVSAIQYHKNSLIEERSERTGQNRGLTIEDCLKSFEEVDELDERNTIYCRRCKTHVRGTKKMDIYKLPNYLIMHLNRFKRHGYSCQKNGAQVNFPLEGLVMETHSGEKISYDLYAVSNHYGSMGGGHYTAYGKNINGNWYDFNDSSVSLLRDISSITSSAAYVLFYKRSNL